MIRIMFITDTYMGGLAGSERYLFNLVTNLGASEFQIDVVQLSTRASLPLESGALTNSPNIKLHHRPVHRVYDPSGFKAYRYCRKLVVEKAIDIVQSIHEKSDIINAFLPTRNGSLAKVSSQRDEGLKFTKRLQFMSSFVNPRFARIIVPSKATGKFVQKQRSAEAGKTQVVTNGVDVRKFEEVTPLSRSSARDRLDIAPDMFCVGCVANLKPVKGHRVIIDAAKCLQSSESQNIQFFLIGDGELRSQLATEIAEAGLGSHVKLVGNRSDVSELLPAFDVVISASFSEGMSNALLEASATGLPIVATNVGGNPEIVQHGVSGYLYEVGDSQGLAGHILSLSREAERKEEMGRNGRRIVCVSFNANSKVKEHAALYHQVIQEATDRA